MRTIVDALPASWMLGFMARPTPSLAPSTPPRGVRASEHGPGRTHTPLVACLLPPPTIPHPCCCLHPHPQHMHAARLDAPIQSSLPGRPVQIPIPGSPAARLPHAWYPGNENKRTEYQWREGTAHCPPSFSSCRLRLQANRRAKLESDEASDWRAPRVVDCRGRPWVRLARVKAPCTE